MRLHRNLNARPETFLQAIAPDREALVVAVACLFTWSWLADRWAPEGIPVGLGPALAMKAIHGGNANHDTIASPKSAALLRGGMLPQASVDPAQRRTTRDRLRRRLHLRRQRAELVAHVQQTNNQDRRPAIGTNLASNANRHGVAERVAEPAVQQSLEVDVALITYDEPRLSDLEWSIVKRATPHEATTFSRRHAVPGVGTILALVMRNDIHDSRRFPCVQDVASYGRLVKCAKESARTRDGSASPTSGKASRQGAFSAAAVLCLRNNPAGQKDLARFAKNQDQGKALTILAHQLARALSSRLQRETVCDLDNFLCGSGEQRG